MEGIILKVTLIIEIAYMCASLSQRNKIGELYSYIVDRMIVLETIN